MELVGTSLADLLGLGFGWAVPEDLIGRADRVPVDVVHRDIGSLGGWISAHHGAPNGLVEEVAHDRTRCARSWTGGPAPAGAS